ncbi:DUF2163 domain-containing protein [Loktanella sp. SALINAS62]|uniref:DUF2163 domain-containing protein n=1 Tax=Loktanella sp. SALINAS62 TaxID=2706124 RepID=UPI001B8B3E0A|nr:DUF2163 domain-containing protein [Loktanella sp. SALINAS62]MBS1303585.1 DUF2163 domain-containing protein [Loktanella sp. SALINAS62]
MSRDALMAHLRDGAAHSCQAWSIVRKDGVVFGFTDHDVDLHFDGVRFQADSGLSARALATSTGLNVDNSEAAGLLQSDVISDVDIAAGRFDGAEITNWLVRWDDVSARHIRFRGEIGEITREAGQFRVALRGLAERLNQPIGRAFLRSCAAVLGDKACRVDLTDSRLMTERSVLRLTGDTGVTIPAGGYAAQWFTHGTLTVLNGPAQGLTFTIKSHDTAGGEAQLMLWDAIRAELRVGDRVRVTAGCDKRDATCRLKFANLINFQGFPDMPGDDWLIAVPRADGNTSGGSLIR